MPSRRDGAVQRMIEKLSVHGVADITDAPSNVLRFMWLFVVTASVLTLTFGIYQSTIDWYHAPILTSISVETKVGLFYYGI